MNSKCCAGHPRRKSFSDGTRRRCLGKRFSDWEFVVPEDLDVVNQVGHRQNQGQEHHNISRNRNYTKLGSILHCEWYNSALYNEAGKLVSVLSLVLDVTVATRIEEALRKSEAQYRLLFESNPQAMWVYDLDNTTLPGGERCCRASLWLLASRVSRHDDQGHSSSGRRAVACRPSRVEKFRIRITQASGGIARKTELIINVDDHCKPSYVCRPARRVCPGPGRYRAQES